MSKGNKFTDGYSRSTPGLEETVTKYFLEDMGWEDDPFFNGQVYYKERPDGCYVVLARPTPDGGWHVTDWAGSSMRGPWFCQNDSEELSDAEWKSLKVDPHCDGFTITEDPR